MAWLYLPASAGSNSPSSDGCAPSATSNEISTPPAESCPESDPVNSTTPQFGTTSPHSTPGTWLAKWISSQEDSPARTSALQARERDWMESAAGFSSRSLGLLARYDPDSSSWRTSQQSLSGGGARWQQPLPRWGLIVDGECFQLSTWERRSFENGGGVWPTLRVSRGDYTRDRGVKGKERLTLSGRVKLWPTPNTGDGRRGANVPDGKRGLPIINQVRLVGRYYSRQVQMMTKDGTPFLPVGLVLNPLFCEALMGFPSGWTVLDASAEQWFRTARKRRSSG